MRPRMRSSFLRRGDVSFPRHTCSLTGEPRPPAFSLPLAAADECFLRRTTLAGDVPPLNDVRCCSANARSEKYRSGCGIFLYGVGLVERGAASGGENETFELRSCRELRAALKLFCKRKGILLSLATAMGTILHC